MIEQGSKPAPQLTQNGHACVASAQVEAALASAERQIERLRARERAHARALSEARHQLREGSCASSAVSEEGCMTPEAGGCRLLQMRARKV